MITITLNERTTLKLYDDIAQLPATRYKEFQKFQIIDSGVGSTMESISERYSKLFGFLNAGRVDDAKKEAENLYYTHYMVITGFNVQHLAFACLVHSISNIEITDLSEENLRDTIQFLSKEGLTQELLEYYLEESKKNSNHN